MANSGDRVRILVVDDEETLCEALRFNLEADGYDVDVAYSAEQALAMDLSVYSLFLLDVMMGQISGTQLASILKNNPVTARTPIIFCTARTEEDDMVAGLELGADDYITKPYSIRNILARVKAVLRRSTQSDEAKTDSMVCKGLEVVPDQKLCRVDGKVVKLPRKEFELLAMLMSQPNHVFSRGELLSRIWPDEVVVLDRVIDVNITRLRQKIRPYDSLIVSRPGYGYVFQT